MTWFVSHPTKYRHAMNEIPKQRDRGAAIIATSILEEHLLEAIQSRLERHAQVEGKVFSGYGPLASFSARIDMGLLLGLYPETGHKRLHLIRRIRNNFAHSMQPITFKSQKGDCHKLASGRNAYRQWHKMFDSILKTQSAVRFGMFRSSTNPRTQFIRAVQQMCMLLSMQIALGNNSLRWEKAGDGAPKPARPADDEARTLLLTRLRPDNPPAS
ncbi:hypothetical protein [Bradyrhizobium sp. RT3b]|uniref:hypothetical protein n=1 Tax=Bradyrhizobium sp. RT3b TaxID=3156334 RepID=UPI003397800A